MAQIKKDRKQPVQAWRFVKIHPLWFSFIKYCEELKYGEIEKLKIQDGLPMIAEEVKRKIKFTFYEE